RDDTSKMGDDKACKAIELLKTGLTKAKDSTSDSKKKIIAEYLMKKLDVLEDNYHNMLLTDSEVKDHLNKLLLSAERAMSHHTNWFKNRSSSSVATAYSVAQPYFAQIRQLISVSIDDKLIRTAIPSTQLESTEYYTYGFFAKHINKNNQFTDDFDAH